ncbi:MAG: class I SAM-dependent methyltransferase [Acidobacteriota bacterium]
MPFYRDYVYPFLVDRLGNPKPIQEVRERILPLARGAVLEIGFGSGANLAYYDPRNVTRLYALEPNARMVQLAEKRRTQTLLDIEFLDLPGERIPLGDRTVDTVVSTFTMCTIPGISEAIRGIRRVLKPHGKLIFFEHALSPDPQVRRWQDRWAAIHYRLFAGLRLTRDIPALLRDGGFCIEWMEAGHLAEFPKSWACFCWGTAKLTATGQ